MISNFHQVPSKEKRQNSPLTYVCYFVLLGVYHLFSCVCFTCLSVWGLQVYVLHTTLGGQHDWRPPYRALHLLEYLHRQAATANVPRQSFLLMLSYSFNLEGYCWTVLQSDIYVSFLRFRCLRRLKSIIVHHRNSESAYCNYMYCGPKQVRSVHNCLVRVLSTTGPSKSDQARVVSFRFSLIDDCKVAWVFAYNYVDYMLNFCICCKSSFLLIFAFPLCLVRLFP